MSYAIIGFGNIGQGIAKAFARNGIEVSLATSRDSESFASVAFAIGPTILRGDECACGKSRFENLVKLD